jgi:hypothetical protein
MPAKIKFSCECGKGLSADPETAGKKAKCPGCGRILVIPQLARTDDSYLGLAPLGDPLPSAGTIGRTRTTPPPLPSNEKTIWEEEEEYKLQSLREDFCPQCRAPMPPDSVVCLDCGYNRKTRTVTAGHVPGSAAQSKDARSKGISGWTVLAVFCVGLAVLYWGSMKSAIVMILGCFAGLFLLAAGLILLAVAFIWYWALLARHNPEGAAKLFVTIIITAITAILTPYAISVLWRGQFEADADFRKPKRIARMGFKALVAGLAIFLAGAIAMVLRGPIRPHQL